MRRTHIFIAGILILSLLTLGCSFCSFLTDKGKDVALTKVATELEPIEGETKSPEKVDPAKPEETEPTATPTPTEEPSRPEPVEEPGTELDDKAYSRLHTLDSYRYEMALEGTEAGQEMTMTGNGAFVKDPPASEFHFEIKEGDQEPNLIRFIRVKDKVYVYDQDEGGWMVIDSDSPMAAGMDMLGLIMEEMAAPLKDDAFKLVDAHQDVNGVDCSYYHADAKDLPEDLFGPDQGKVTGGSVDVWVANGAGHLMRLSMEMEGEDKEGKAMEAWFTLEVYDVNQPIQIDPPPEDQIIQDLTSEGKKETPVPAESEGIARMLPKPEDASEPTGTNLATAQAFTAGTDFDYYQTELSVAKAAEFFQEALAKEGWEAEESMPPTEQVAFLFFSKGDKTVNVILYGVEGGCIVVLYVE